MPTTVYDIVHIELSDGTPITLRPLTIKSLKKFKSIISKADNPEIETEDEILDIFIEAAMACLEYLKPELSTDKDKFEEIIEIPTLMKILEIAGGLKLNDPNLLGAALVGTN